MLLSKMYWGWMHIFRFQHFLLNENIFNSFLKIEGESLTVKKIPLSASFKNSRKIAIFWGGLLHTEKKRRQGKKENSLHMEDKIAIFATFVLRSIVLFFFLKFWFII